MTTKGFTLIEVIIVIVLTGIALPALILAISQGTRDSYKSELITIATHLAQGKMEEITKVKFLNHSGFNKMTASVFPSENTEISGVNYAIYSDFSTIKTGVKLARVRVSSQGMPDITVEAWFANYSTLK